MVEFSDEFKEFLKAYGKDTCEDATDEKRRSIYNDNISKFENWEKVPQAVRNRYAGRVPEEVLEIASRGDILVLREMEYHPNETVSEAKQHVAEQYQRVPDDIVSETARNAFVAAAIAGYSISAATELARTSQERASLYDELSKFNHLSKEEREKNKDYTRIRALYLETRKQDIETIKKEWSNNHPDRMLIHLLSKYNRQLAKGENIDEKTKQTLVADLTALAKKIDTDDKREKLLHYMQSHRIQLKIAHFKPEVLELLENTVLPNAKINESERNNILENAEKHRARIEKMLSAEQKAHMVAENINTSKQNLPKENGLSIQERMANMPSVLNKQREM